MSLYREAGVDIQSGSAAVKRIAGIAASTHSPQVLSTIGGFSGLYHAGALGYKDLVLASGADGVGTKVKISQALGKHDTVGIDLVAMNADDVVTSGARPLFFLDYIAVGRLEPGVVADIVKGVATGCQLAGCVLLGGETAQMADIYKADEYDLAGFCVGGLEKDKIIDGRCITKGDVLVGFASSGAHSNGFSLIRKVLLEEAKMDLGAIVPEFGRTLGEELLEPTRVYSKVVLDLIESLPVKGLAHITGGGITGNVPRIFPKGLRMNLSWDWPILPVFSLIQEVGRIPDDEMRSVFNMGIGMVAIVAADHVDKTLSIVRSHGFEAYVMGEMLLDE